MITGSFYPEITGGGFQCLTLMNSLKRYGYEFFVITTTKDKFLKYSHPNFDIKRIYMGDKGFIAEIKSAWQLVSAFLRIQRNISIVHFHGFSKKTILVIALAKIFRKKIVQKMTSLGEDDPVSLIKKPFGFIKFFFFSMADAFVSVSPSISKKFIESKLPVDKLFTIPNGVDIDKFSPVGSREEKNNLRKKLGLPENTFIIMFVGFFSEDKGPDILVEAYKIVKKNIKADMRVLFVGSTKGVYYEIKASLVKKIKDGIKGDCLEKDIIFVEKTLEIEEYYRCSDLFVLSSKREGLPNALLEAMASGLPCVSSNLDGVVGYLIFDDKEGMLFNSGDIHGLSRAVCRVFEDRKLAKDLGYSAREKVIKNFSIGIVAGQYKKLYEAYYRKEAVN